MTMDTYNGDLLQAMKWAQNNAPGLTALITAKDKWYNNFHTLFWSQWEENVFDLRTANNFGLQVWCIILGVPSAGFGLYPASNAWAYGANRQNYIYSGLDTTIPADDRNTVGGNFYGGGSTEILNLDEIRNVLRLRYVALVSNGNVAFINRMLRYIFNDDAEWDFANGVYFYLADKSLQVAGVSNAAIYKTDWSGNHLLYPTARTNMVLYSQTLAWTLTSLSITNNTTETTAPDGSQTANKLVEALTTTASNHAVLRQVTIASGTTYTYSVYLKAAERTSCLFQLGNFGAQSNSNAVYVDLAAGTFTATHPENTTMTAVGNGWYRLTTTVTTIAATYISPSIYLRSSATSTSYIGDGVSGLYAWGAQLEVGSVASELIPTTTAAVTRTDYTLNASTGAVALAVAPPSTATLYWTGSWGQQTITDQQLFGTGDGTTVSFTLSKPKGFVGPLASGNNMEYRIGSGLGMSSQLVNLMNTQEGLVPSISGYSYEVILES